MCRRRLASAAMLIIFMLLLIGACTAAPKKNLPAPSGGIANRIQSDTNLFQEGFVLLGTSGKPADYGKARQLFDQLIRGYPQSKWRSYAETYRQLLDDVNVAFDRASIAHADAKKTQTEMEALRLSLEQVKKSNRLLQEKVNTETARLLQENEQLRSDLQRLKQLEIDLQRRDRSSR
jgi:hypothetical protein